MCTSIFLYCKNSTFFISNIGLKNEVFVGVLLMLVSFLFYLKKPLDGYKFPVYTTESCPRNHTEWSERSSAINCTDSNGYLCLPSEDLTELLEFCYFDYQIPIEKGKHS